MPRRRETGALDDVVRLLARLPWWGCLLFGLVAWLVLHAVATRPLPTPVVTNRIDNLPDVMIGSALRGIAGVGQIVLPMLAVVAAVISFVGRRQRKELFERTTDDGASAAAIDALSWQDFERLIAEAFRLQGYSVVEKGGAGADGGVDLELTKDGERWLVQAKHWRARQVPVEVVRELAGVMAYRRAVGAYVVSSGRFTGPAAEFASGRGIRLVDGSRLQGMLNQARASLDGRPRDPTISSASSVSPPHRTAAPSGPLPVGAGAGAGSRATPSCPACGRPMVVRQARRGANAGTAFWGCSGYPDCKGSRRI